ncbi:hypothetical protein ACH47X_09125 [Promicromonospora kroppenstedtii]|uniref:ESAT-6 protein secretion system EspG family protein n=1 Tax=Promicromonospora kroppenstedtii TaxID=440482 RepID=A0ABW7XHR9_9MICO
MTTSSTPTAPSTPPAPGLPGWTWRVEPPDNWIVVPALATEDAEDVAAWEREALGAVRESLRTQYDAEPAEPVELDDAGRAALDRAAAESVANLRAFADGMAAEGHRVVAALGVLGRGPVPVLVAVGASDPADPDDGLLAALGATGGNPVSPPTVEYPDLPEGDGVRVTRLDVGEFSGGGWLSIGLGRRAEYDDVVVDTVLVWRSQDLMLGAAMLELLDELLPAVRVVRTAA